MSERFSERVVIVTGAASGIGRTTALALARESATLVLGDLDSEGGTAVAHEIGGDTLFVRCDVSVETDVARLVSAAFDLHGQLDAAVNNAGIEGARAPITDYDTDEWRRVIDVDLVSVFLCMKHELRVMRQQGSGVIVNTSSIFGSVAATQASAYVAAKHGVIGLTKAGALEGSAFGVRVNAVCPGYIATPMVLERQMNAAADPDVMAAILAKQPSGRLGSPEEIASAILWLLSDESAYVNGHALVVDGGYVVR